jgi:DNA-binding PadR family transcriptional regulator
MKDLTKIEEILLIAIWRLEDEAYGVKIRQHVSQFLGKEFTYGNLYSALHQLTVKKYVEKALGEPTPARRGRRKINYRVTPRGREALKSAQEMNKKLWRGLSDLAFDRKE